MAESKTSGSSGSGSSATQEKQDDKRFGLSRDKDGNVQPLPYPETDVLDKITYRDPRPIDWPQKADRSVFIGVVNKRDADDDDPKGRYVYANDIDDEVEVGGTVVDHAQVVAGSGQLTLILNGQAYVLGALGGAVSADLQRALQTNANS